MTQHLIYNEDIKSKDLFSDTLLVSLIWADCLWKQDWPDLVYLKLYNSLITLFGTYHIAQL